MQPMTHLSFNGECAAAFRLYAECLGGEITFMLTYGESPAPSAPELKDKIAHATLKFGGQVLTGVDVAADKYERPQGFALQLNIESLDDAERIFNALAREGLVQFAMQQTYWAERYGMVTDRFGVPWEMNCTTKRVENA